MASTFSTLKIELIATGEQSGTWGASTNDNLGSAVSGSRGLEQAIVGMATLVTGDFTSNVYTMPYTDNSAAQNFRAFVLNITATLSAAGTVNVPAIQKPYIVMNNSVGGYAVTVKVSGQTGVSVPNGAKILVYNNGTDVGSAITHLTSLTLGSALPVASGGTGQTTYTDGQLLIGNSTGNTLTKSTLTAGSGISITNGSGSVTIAATNSGTVTSVTASAPLASSGGATPDISLTGTVAVANGGTGQTTYTNGQLLIGNTTGNTLTKSTLTAGSGISITNGTGSITIAATTTGATITNDTSTATNVYPVFAAATTGSLTTAYTSNAKLLYKPSTGELQASELVASNGLLLNSTTVAASYTIATGTNAMSVGPITVASGQSVTVSSGQKWVVI